MSVVRWPLVLGIGSHQGDDQAGWLVVDSLRRRGYPAAWARALLNPAAALDHLIDANVDSDDSAMPVILCDALDWPTDAGEVGAAGVALTRRWVWPELDGVWRSRFRQSHDLGLVEVLSLWVQLRVTRRPIVVWGIQGRCWLPESAPSAAVVAAANEVAATIWAEVHAEGPVGG